jgi:hypothetical protein
MLKFGITTSTRLKPFDQSVREAHLQSQGDNKAPNRDEKIPGCSTHV